MCHINLFLNLLLANEMEIKYNYVGKYLLTLYIEQKIKLG